MKDNTIQLLSNGKRLDGRTAREMRSIKIVPNVVRNAGGSAYLEWGRNKVIAAVYGPGEALPRHTANPDRAVIKCRYMMAPFSSSEEHGRAGMNRRAIEISKVTAEVFENIVLLDQFPGTEINVYIEVLQSDGGTRAAGITCASVAFALSGIPMKDLPYAVSVGKVGEEVILDLDKLEDNYSDADMPLAILPRTNSIALLQMDGTMTKKQFDEGIALALEAGKTISKLQKDALISQYLEQERKYR